MAQPTKPRKRRKNLKRRKARRDSHQFRPLLLELLERRDLFAVETISLADPSFWGDSSLGFPVSGTLQSGDDVSMSADGQIVAFESRANNLVARDLNVADDVFFYDRGTGRVELVSANALGDPANNSSFNPRVTPDGRFIFFNSDAKDLDQIINVTVNGTQVYRYEVATRQTRLVSANATNDDGGLGGGNLIPSFSDDGRFVTWSSSSTNLVVGDTNNQTDIFLRDLDLNTTTLVSHTQSGAFANGSSSTPFISANGQVVVFSSNADNIVNNDTNTAPDLFRFDRLVPQANLRIELVTPNLNNTGSGGGFGTFLSAQPISADGRFIVFESSSNQLVSQPVVFGNVFLRDAQTDTTTLLSIHRNGTLATNGFNAVITPNGQFASFTSTSNDVASDVLDTNNLGDVFLVDLRNLASISRRMVSVTTDGLNGGNRNSGAGDVSGFTFADGFVKITPDGRHVAFSSEASNLVSGIIDANDGFSTDFFRPRRDTFVRDMQTNSTRLVSRNALGTSTGNNGSYVPSLSSDGQIVAFASHASDLIGGIVDANREADVFVTDLGTGITKLASPHSPLLDDAVFSPFGVDSLQDLSADGRFVVFVAAASPPNYLATNVNGPAFFSAVFLRDRQTGVTEQISVRLDGVTGVSANNFQARVSDNGRFVAFSSSNAASDMQTGVTDTAGRNDVFVRDRVSGTISLISRTAGNAAGNEASGEELAMSPDGRYIAFTSRAKDLVSGVNFPAAFDEHLYLHDRQTGITTLVDLQTDGVTPGVTTGTFSPRFNEDGSRLVFVSPASGLIAGVTETNPNGNEDVFVLNLATGALALASPSNTNPNVSTGGVSGVPSISRDGRFVTFVSNATNLASITTSNTQVFRHDLLSGTTDLVSMNSTNNGGANAGASSPFISEDGSRVVFQSTATNLSPLAATTFRSQVFMRDFSGGSPITSLISLSSDGSAAGNADSRVQITLNQGTRITADNRYVAFISAATNLVSGFVDANGASGFDLFVRDLQTGITQLASHSFSGTSGGDVDANNTSNKVFLLAAQSPTLVFDSQTNNLRLGDNNIHSFEAGRNDIFAFTLDGAASIRGRVYQDDDGNGNQNGAESGLPHRSVFLDENSNQTLDPGETVVQTDLAGDYAFTSLAAGNYNVAFVLDDGFARTEPAAAPGTYAVNLATNTSTVSDRDFGQRRIFVDLATDVVLAPLTAESGEKVNIQFVVRNAGGTPINGNWQDAVYASADSVLDASDTLLATVPRSGPLAANASYTGSVDVTLPAVLESELHFIVVADNRRQIVADENRANNLAASLNATQLNVPALTLGTPTAGVFTEPLENHYFRIQVPVGETLSISLDSAAAAGITELYASRVRLPTPANHEFSAIANAPDQTLVIPQTITPGEYFILARSRTGAAATSAFTLTANLLAFGISGVSPNVGGNTGRVTIAVQGSRFTPETSVQLLSGATTLNAVATELSAAGELFATFDLTGVAIGGYNVKVSDGAANAMLAGGFTVAAGVANPLEIQLITPGFIRQGRISSVIVEYTNTGNTDMVAPLLGLSATDAVMRLEDQDGFTGSFTEGSSVQFLAIAPDGPAGVLRPGQTGRVRVLFRATPGEAGVAVEFHISLLEPGNTIDWLTMRDRLRPDSVRSLEAWNAIFDNFLGEVGTSTDSLNALLAANSSYLSNLGIRTPNMARLLGFEIDQAYAKLAARTLAGTIDAAVSTPGLPLEFGRSFQQSIAGRYGDLSLPGGSPLGRGWETPWHASASGGPVPGDDDAPVVIDQGGSRRFFIRGTDGVFRGIGGDVATLEVLPPGAQPNNFRLRESDGTRFEFLGGLLRTVTDPQGNQISATYGNVPAPGGQAMRLLQLAHSSGQTLALSYNAAGLISVITDSTGRNVVYQYDALSHLTSVSDAAGTTTYAYVTGQGAQREHALASITNIDGKHVFFEYDARGRLVSMRKDGNAEAVALAYDDFAGLTFTDALGATQTILHNDAGGTELVRDALGRESQFEYDRNFNLVQLITPANTSFQYAYDTRNNMTRSVDALGRELNFSYTSEFNQLASLTDARGNTTRYAYDGESNLASITYPNAGIEGFSYDPLGNLTETVNRRGQAIELTVDARGRTTRKDFADGSIQTFTFDNHDNLLTATSAAGTTSLVYDAADRLTRIDYPVTPLAPLGRTLQFFYDAGGRRIRSVDQDGFEVKYSYDSVGRLFELRNGANALIVRYTYDAVGQLVEKLNGNDTYTTYAYDAAGQLLSLVNRQSRPSPGVDGPLNSRFDYTYDALGLRSSMTLTDSDPATPDGATTYGYDAIGQLTLVTLPGGRTIAYAYDAAGNRTQVVDSQLGTMNYTTNNLNQILTAGATSFTYDADGNLATQTDLAGLTAYAWDSENQLIEVNGPGSTFQYEIDLFGIRSAQTRNGARTEYLTDPTNLVNVFAEYAGAGLVAHYTSGSGLTSRVASNGASTFYDFDALGGTTGLTNAAGQYVSRYSYLPFGETTTHASAVANAFTFVGQFGVSQSGDGLSLMRFRNYSTVTGQFVSDDPIGLAGGTVNVRAYVGNQPTGYIDPLGLAGVITERNIVDFVETFKESGETIVINGEKVIINSDDLRRTDELQKISTKSGEGNRLTRQIVRRNILKDAQTRIDAARSVGSKGLLGRGLGILGKGAGLLGPLIAIAPLLPSASDAARRVGEDVANSPEGQQLTDEFVDAVGNGFRDLCDLFPDLCRLIPPVFAQDPNDIIGPFGQGPQNFIQPTSLLPYTIHFENQDTATAPAQEVFVTLPLSPHLDLSAFELGDFGFGPLIIDVPDGLQQYQERVEFTNPDGSPLFVDFSASLDPITRIVSWVFRSVDPDTGEFPEDALAGFLPPNNDEGSGEGFVEFAIRSLSGVAPGTEIRSVASIVFDTNAPIFTNQVDPQNPAAGTDPNKEALVTLPGPNQTLKRSNDGLNIVIVDDAGVELFSQPLTSTTPIVRTGLASSFTLDYRGGVFNIPGGLTYNGGGTGFDRLLVLGDTSIKLTDTSVTVKGAKKALVISGVDLATLIGGAGNNKLDAAKFSGDVILDGGAGKDSLTGGLGDDTFLVGAGKKTIKGNAGTDTVFADAGGAVTLTNKKLASNAANASLGTVESIDLTGSAAADVFTVTGWTGSATLNGGGGTDRIVLVADINMTLTDALLTRSIGGALALASFEAAELTGGKSNNTLDASTFSGFTFLNGVAGNDILKAGLGGSLLLGGKGDDNLQGNLGRDLLFGGAGLNTLAGGAGEDLLFAKPAKFETKRATLDALFAQWSRTDLDFAGRTAMLAGGTTGIAKFPKLDAKALKSDKLADTLTGGADLDWFFADLPLDTITDVVDLLTDFKP